MTLRKITEHPSKSWDKKKHEICHDPEHYPPMHMLFEPGTWENLCPSCGKVTRFTVPEITC
jgi:hypothetical protein